jgi:hypothetical protein
MPISVKAAFAQDGVFFAGEKLNCTITFTNSSVGSGGLLSAISESNGASTPSRPSTSLQHKLQAHHDQQLQQQQESNGHGNNSQRNLAPSSPQSQHASSQQQPVVAPPTSPPSTSALDSPSGSPLNSNNTQPNNIAAIDTHLKTQPRSDAPQQRPGTTAGRAQSQTRLSSDISHIDVSSRNQEQELNGQRLQHQQQGSEDQEQEEQEEQEKTIAAPVLSDDEGAGQSPVSLTPQQANQMEHQQHQEGGLASISSPGLLGLASFVYRSASFSSLANAFGLSGSESEQQHLQQPYGT